eukprot:5851593-Alexandrium_andersonii.AAC.1
MRGGVLWLLDDGSVGLGDLVGSPNGRAPKMNPDRTVSSKGRVILDMRVPNLGGGTRNHPPVIQPQQL